MRELFADFDVYLFLGIVFWGWVIAYLFRFRDYERPDIHHNPREW